MGNPARTAQPDLKKPGLARPDLAHGPGLGPGFLQRALFGPARSPAQPDVWPGILTHHSQHTYFLLIYFLWKVGSLSREDAVKVKKIK